MDWTKIAIGAIVLSSGVIGWGLVRSKDEPVSENQRNLTELAYYVLLIAGFGLLVILKLMTFAGVLLAATLLTGAVWAWDVLVGARRRPKERAEPMLVEISRGFFPIILVVFLLRSFLVEPFKIPSGSMIPSLLVGDFILVNKYTYGIRLPVANRKIVDVNDPRRGDVMVFRFPADPSTDYIKRIIGIPGDRVEYRDKHLWVNGTQLPLTAVGPFKLSDAGHTATHQAYIEKLGDTTYSVIFNPGAPPLQLAQVIQFPFRGGCSYSDSGFACTVPAGHYFVMGDNRDHSLDSRYWGFVPERNIVGKAFLIWMNFSDLQRIGKRIH